MSFLFLACLQHRICEEYNGMGLQGENLGLRDYTRLEITKIKFEIGIMQCQSNPK